jgi:diguanylate cyclase (GGDEF)-like protein
MSDHPLCEFFGITPEEIALRRAYLALGDADSANMRTIREVLEAEVPAIVDEFYTHLEHFDEARAFFADQRTRQRLQEAQRRHLAEMGQNDDQQDYFEERLRIGIAHEKNGLAQKWYLGGYATLFERIGTRVVARCDGDPATVLSLLGTLHKAFLQEIILVVETYHQAAKGRLEHVLNELNETQRHLQEMSRMDGLTGVSNRKHIMEALSTEIYRARRFNHRFCLMLLDVDHFKSINDTHGHLFGDYALREMVRHVKGAVRPVDLLGRYGGEEFILGAVECDAEAACQLAERIRQAVEAGTFQQDGRTAPLTLSIGLTELRPEDKQITELVQRADEALYRAKHNGRNRVEIG